MDCCPCQMEKAGEPKAPAFSAVGELFVVNESSVSFSRASSRSPWHDSSTLVMICSPHTLIEQKLNRCS